MAKNNMELPVCQSCGKPTKKPDEFGTNEDGSRNREFCNFCFKNGEFTYPGIGVEQMIDIYAGLTTVQSDISDSEAKEMAKSLIPGLKRWK